MIDAKHYNFAFLDEGSKREIRRSILKAVAIPGYQVPLAPVSFRSAVAGEPEAFRLPCQLSAEKMC